MARVKFTGMADERSFLKSDFQGKGVDDQDAVKFNASNDFTNDVSDAAAKLLTENPTTKRDFKIIEDEATDADTDKEAAASDSDGSTGTADAAAPSTAKSRKRTT